MKDKDRRIAKEDKKKTIVINQSSLILKSFNPFRNLRSNWQVKLIAFILALSLWFYLYKK